MNLRFLTAGESHGKGLIGVLEGMPAGLSMNLDTLHSQLRRRKLGFGRGNRMNIETDEVEIFAGVRHGCTIGSPIALLIRNRDFERWQDIMSVEASTAATRRVVHVPRPGHADRVGGIKYGHSDMRNVLERASARETAMRVALATFARSLLEQLGVSIASRVVMIGRVRDHLEVTVPIRQLNEIVDRSPTRCLGDGATAEMVRLIESAKRRGDTLGGTFEIYASGLPIGLGGYAQWDRRVEAEIGRALLSLNAITGVEVGIGFAAAAAHGSEVHDAFYPGIDDTKRTYGTNNSGGIVGGMTTGQTLIVRAAMKPLSTLTRPLPSVDLSTGKAAPAHIERSDVCAVPAAAVIAESLLALILADKVLEKFGGDSMEELLPRVSGWAATVRQR